MNLSAQHRRAIGLPGLGLISVERHKPHVILLLGPIVRIVTDILPVTLPERIVEQRIPNLMSGLKVAG